MDPNGDITDTFDDEELANTIESGQKGPWNDGSAIFEDPKVAKLKQEMDGTKSRDYQQRRLRELQERTAKAAAKNAPKTEEPTAQTPEWGESESSWGEEAASNEQGDPFGWGSSDAAETAKQPAASTPPARQHASASPKSLPAKAAKPATNYTVAAIVAVAVIAAAAFAFGLFGG